MVGSPWDQQTACPPVAGWEAVAQASTNCIPPRAPFLTAALLLACRLGLDVPLFTRLLNAEVGSQLLEVQVRRGKTSLCGTAHAPAIPCLELPRRSADVSPGRCPCLPFTGIAPSTPHMQYRMHPAIAYFPSRQFYGGRVRSGVTQQDRPPLRVGAGEG